MNSAVQTQHKIVCTLHLALRTSKRAGNQAVVYVVDKRIFEFAIGFEIAEMQRSKHAIKTSATVIVFESCSCHSGSQELPYGVLTCLGGSLSPLSMTLPLDASFSLLLKMARKPKKWW